MAHTAMARSSADPSAEGLLDGGTLGPPGEPLLPTAGDGQGPAPVALPIPAPVITTASPFSSEKAVLERLAGVAEERGPAGLSERLADLYALTQDDLRACEQLLAELPRGPSLVERSGGHLIDLGGKRLRPLCVALAARTGSGFGPAAREFAVAVELVHNATLLHDDVVDMGERRRGAPTSRILYGNAASIFAGDWLLIEALRRVRRAEVPGVLERLLDVIDEMIFAESVQLERRGRVQADRATYFHVIEGKTAALFRWAMFAGGAAGGHGGEHCAALERYGLHLGVAFQAIDDWLDLAGEAGALGKGLFADLREGKMTFPMIVALEREPGLRGVVEQIVATSETEPLPAPLVAEVLRGLERTGALAECRALAEGRAAEAAACLAPLPASAARSALVTVAHSAVHREA